MTAISGLDALIKARQNIVDYDWRQYPGDGIGSREAGYTVFGACRLVGGKWWTTAHTWLAMSIALEYGDVGTTEFNNRVDMTEEWVLAAFDNAIERVKKSSFIEPEHKLLGPIEGMSPDQT